MKKIFVLLFAIILIFNLASCGKDSDGDNKDGEKQGEQDGGNTAPKLTDAEQIVLEVEELKNAALQLDPTAVNSEEGKEWTIEGTVKEIVQNFSIMNQTFNVDIVIEIAEDTYIISKNIQVHKGETWSYPDEALEIEVGDKVTFTANIQWKPTTIGEYSSDIYMNKAHLVNK